MEMSNLLSEQLKALCKRDKMSQKELAEKLFVSQQAVGKWEKDTAASNPDTLAKSQIFSTYPLTICLDFRIKKFRLSRIRQAKKGCRSYMNW